MCGLVGICGAEFKERLDIFHQLLLVGEVRGPHGTGAGIGYSDGSAALVKVQGPPIYLFNEKEYWEKVHKDTKKQFALIGHNRYATKGEKNSSNAHPFLHGNILLAHNGTLTDYSKLTETPYDTDSEVICDAVSRMGIDWVWKNLCGAAALSFYDARERSLNLITNGQRTLHAMLINHGRNLVWASEEGMLTWVVKRCLPTHTKFEEPVKLGAHKLMTVQLVNGSLKMEVRDLPPFSYPVTVTFGGAYEDWRGNGSSSVPYVHGKKKKEYKEKAATFCSEVMTEEEFNLDYKECSFCFEPLKGQFDGSIFIDDDNVACPLCSSHYKIKEVIP